ncbi:MAG: ABC transporter substrate-binding protein [Dehalococcoidia bacterium]
MKRRTLVRHLAIGIPSAVALTMIGCGDDDEEEKEGGPSPAGTVPATASAAATAPAQLKDLVVGIPADTTNLDGDKATVGLGSPNANIYDTLLIMTSEYEVKPHLAEKFEFIAPNTWRFSLRKGVKFHDGSELKAADVAWTLDRVARAGGRAINAQEGGTKVIDDYTVEYTPSRANLKIPLQIVHPTFGIMKANSNPIQAPVGTGPFKFASYAPKESMKVERFEGHWNQARLAKVKSVTFRYIPDNNARVLALQAGDADIITQVPRESVSQLKDKYAVVVSKVGAYEALSVQINGQGDFALTSDAKLREAVAMAVDRETIVKSIWEGNAELGKNLIPPSILGAAKDVVKGGPKFNLEGSKKALDDLGWKPGSDGIREKDGKKLELTLINGFPDAASHRPIPEVLQQQLRKAGISIKIVEVTNYDETLKGGQGHLWLERGNQNDANPAFLPTLLYLSLEAGNKAGEDYARAFGVGKEVDEPLLAAAQTADIPKTQQLAAQAMKVLIDDKFVIIPIAGLYNITATAKAVTGWTPHSALVHSDFAMVVKA